MSWAGGGGGGGGGGAREVVVVVPRLLELVDGICAPLQLQCTLKFHLHFTHHGLSSSCQRAHLLAMFINFLKQCGATFPTRNGSIIAAKVSPLSTHSGISVEEDLAHNTSNNTIANEKRSDFSVSCPDNAYSRSR
ncbi:hypothetical protein FF1_033730 [Malus domestica]